jgi:hypothetical protein
MGDQKPGRGGLGGIGLGQESRTLSLEKLLIIEVFLGGFELELGELFPAVGKGFGKSEKHPSQNKNGGHEFQKPLEHGRNFIKTMCIPGENLLKS